MVLALKLDGARSRALREDEAAPSYEAQAFHIADQRSSAELKTWISRSDDASNKRMKLQSLLLVIRSRRLFSS